MNKIIISGNVCRDPEIHYTQGNEPMAIAKYSLAVQRKFDKEKTDFLNCVAFRKNGEFAEKYIRKGQRLIVEGSVQTGSYVDKDGNKRYTTDIIVDNQEFTESKASFEARGNAPSAPKAPEGIVEVSNIDDDDLPF